MTPGDESVAESARAVHQGASVVRRVEAALTRIAETESRLHAYLHVRADGALRDAAELDRMDPEARAALPLAGVVVAVKDNLVVKDAPTTAGSKILEGYRPPYTATAVARLQAAGALVIGKTNLDEFAMGSSTEHSAYGPTKNPWDATRVPGGSSGGSAAAVAAGTALVALGSDTGGSVRQPAAFCGVVGLKPTYGRVSRYGLLAFASSLDQVGPIGRRVADVAQVFHVMAGRDPHDATSVDGPGGDPTPDARGSLKGLRVGLVGSQRDQAGRDARAALDEAERALSDRGAVVSAVDLPHSRYGIAAYYVVAPAEASSNLARYDGVRYGVRGEGQDLAEVYVNTRGKGFGTEVKRRILLGTFALAEGYYDAYYLKALKTRTLLAQDYRAAFQAVDVLLTPTVPETAFRLGEKLDDPWAMYQSDVMTVGANLTGLPALSLPWSVTAGGLPTAIQLTAPWLEEARLFSTAAALEASRPRPWVGPAGEGRGAS